MFYGFTKKGVGPRLLLCAALMVASASCSDPADVAVDEALPGETSEVASDVTTTTVAAPPSVRRSLRSFMTQPGRVRATVLGLGLNMALTGDGALDLHPTPAWDLEGKPAEEAWSYRMGALSYGRSGSMHTPAPLGEVEVSEHRASVSYDDGTRLDYIYQTQGLEQIVVLPRKPKGEGELLVAFEVDSPFRHVVEDDGQRLDVLTDEGARRFFWTKLVVFDAQGTQVPARMEVTETGVAYRIDDREARYPLTVDPLATSPSFTAEGSTASGEFGRSINDAGDVNGDGYGDIIVGAPYYESEAAHDNEGRALVFLGSAQGLESVAAWAVEPNQLGSAFGFSVDSARDIDGDGLDDVIVSAPGFSGSFNSAGRIFVYLGRSGSVGPSTTPIWFFDGEADNMQAGWVVVGLGDANCDGRNDIAFSAAIDANGGKIWTFYGAAMGVFDATPWTYTGPFGLGWSMAAAGNVNGDDVNGNPCHDLAVGYPFASGATGQVLVFHGSATGLSATPDLQMAGDQASSRFGSSVGGAGDVNNDGFDDLIVGARTYDNTGQNEGRASVHLGSATGLSATPDWTAFGEVDDADFGYAVDGAGDVNNDGHADVIVGARHHSQPQFREGAAYVFRGSPNGLETEYGWRVESNETDARLGFDVSSAGDVDNDGFDDVIAAAPGHEANGLGGAGAVYGYPGAADCYINGTFYEEGEADPTNSCAFCDPATSRSSFTTGSDGMACDDGNPCTSQDTCQAGVCVAGAGGCDDMLACTADMCDLNSSSCENTLLAGFCLIDGECFANGDLNPDNSCQSCDATADPTSWSPTNAGQSCNDGLFCTVNDTCDTQGNCAGDARDCSGSATTCAPNPVCSEQADECRASSFAADGTICDDANPCTSNTTCQQGVCQGITLDCSQLDDECNAGMCDPATGTCTTNPLEDGTPCDVDNACTAATCQAGTCVAQMVECSDGNECTEDLCDPATGCFNQPVADGTSCADDGLSCTTDSCQAGACAHEVLMGYCLIDGSCVVEGQSDPTNECMECQPTVDATAYTTSPQGDTCGDATCDAEGDGVLPQICNGNGTCIEGASEDCGDFLCDVTTASCFEACTTDAECDDPARCVEGTCVSTAPQAVVTGPNTAECNQMITLDGSGSSDPAGLMLTYQWSQTAGTPNLLDNVDTTQPTLTFTMADGLLQDVDFRFELVVSNGVFESDPAEHVVSVAACPPTVEPDGDAGPDAGVDAGADAGEPEDDAGIEPDLGQPGPDVGPEGGELRGSGCFCSSSEPYPTDASWLVLALIGFVGFVRRRSRRAKDA